MDTPTVIRIREQSERDGNFHAAISFDHGPLHPITVRAPFEEKQEQELEWYFEEHLRFPFTNQVRAKEVAASITAYGEAPFMQVFRDNADVYAESMSLLKTGLESARIEIMGEPALHVLHWEALNKERDSIAFISQKWNRCFLSVYHIFIIESEPEPDNGVHYRMCSGRFRVIILS